MYNIIKIYNNKSNNSNNNSSDFNSNNDSNNISYDYDKKKNNNNNDMYVLSSIQCPPSGYLKNRQLTAQRTIGPSQNS